jgi:hypothetical protein
MYYIFTGISRDKHFSRGISQVLFLKNLHVFYFHGYFTGLKFFTGGRRFIFTGISRGQKCSRLLEFGFGFFSRDIFTGFSPNREKSREIHGKFTGGCASSVCLQENYTGRTG